MEHVPRRDMCIVGRGPRGRGVTVVAVVRRAEVPCRLARGLGAVVTGTTRRPSTHLAMVKVNFGPTGGDVAVLANI